MWRTLPLGLVVALERIASAEWGSGGTVGSGSAQPVASAGGDRHGLGILFVAVVVLGLLVLSKYLPSTKRQKKPPATPPTDA